VGGLALMDRQLSACPRFAHKFNLLTPNRGLCKGSRECSREGKNYAVDESGAVKVITLRY